MSPPLHPSSPLSQDASLLLLLLPLSPSFNFLKLSPIFPPFCLLPSSSSELYSSLPPPLESPINLPCFSLSGGVSSSLLPPHFKNVFPLFPQNICPHLFQLVSISSSILPFPSRNPPRLFSSPSFVPNSLPQLPRHVFIFQDIFNIFSTCFPSFSLSNLLTFLLPILHFFSPYPFLSPSFHFLKLPPVFPSLKHISSYFLSSSLLLFLLFFLCV